MNTWMAMLVPYNLRPTLLSSSAPPVTLTNGPLTFQQNKPTVKNTSLGPAHNLADFPEGLRKKAENVPVETLQSTLWGATSPSGQ